MTKKIMMVMLKTLGDVICSTTIVRELKKEYPDSEIYFFTNRPYQELLQNNPDIHEVLHLDNWNVNQLFIEMASDKYDKVFAPYQMRPECNVWHQVEMTRHQHLVDFYWQRMGMHRLIEDRECYLYPSQADFDNCDKHITLDSPRIALHSTTGVATKDWPHFDDLAEEMRKAGYGCVQVGAPNDKRIKGAVDLRGKMGLLELAAFLSKCAVFIGLDSGISYMADAMKTSTIVIQGSTSPVTSGPISRRVIHLFAEKTGYDDCQKIRCHTNCRHERNCINEITVSKVIESLEPILSSWRKPIPAGVE